MKHVLFMNPPRRNRRGRFTRRRRSFTGRRVRHRRVRRNPPKMTAAMRHKISLAVKRANRARGSARVSRRSRRRSVAVRRSSPPRMTPAMRRKVSLGVRRSFARRRSGGGFGRLRRRFGGGGGGAAISLKGMFSRHTLMIAGGAIGSGLLTSIVLNRFGNMLPMAATPIGSIAYRALIPFAGAYLTRKFNRQLAEGMMIGGVILALNEAIRVYLPQIGQIGAGAPATIAGAGEYLNGYSGAIGTPGYDAANAFGQAPSVYDSEPAFTDSAWN